MIAGLLLATLLQLTPVEDTYLNLNTINASTEARLNLYTWPAQKIANAILLRFDLATVPTGAQVESATLSLYLEASGGAASYRVSVHRIVNKNPVFSRATGYTSDGVNAWSPSPCCYNGIPMAQADIAPAVDSQSVDQVLGWKTWTVTGIVSAWLTMPASNFGLLINSDPAAPADSFRFFASRESPDVTRRPQLVVSYTLGPIPPPPLQLTVSWRDNATTESGFHLYRRPQTGASWTLLATLGLNATSYVDQAVAAGTVYCFRVTAFNAAGESAPSNEACGLPGAVAVPSTPVATLQSLREVLP